MKLKDTSLYKLYNTNLHEKISEMKEKEKQKNSQYNCDTYGKIVSDVERCLIRKGKDEKYEQKCQYYKGFGWYRYNTRFGIPVYDEDGNLERYNIFSTRMLVRCDADGKLYLYDLVRTKKETSKPHEQQLYGSKLRFFLTPIIQVYVLFVKKKILKGCDFMAYSQQLWDEAKRKCKLGEEEIRMAKEMGLNPKSLIKNIPNKSEQWKAPVKEWIHDMYDKRQEKSRKKAERKTKVKNNI